MDDPKRSQIRSYFARMPARFPQSALAAAALGLIILYAANGPFGYFMGALALAVGGGTCAYWFRGQPSEAQLDSWLQEDLKNLEPRALAKGSLDPVDDLVGDPVTLVGPRFRHLGGAEFGFRKGSDGRARFTPVNVTIINFTAHQLVLYQCALDLTTGKALNESVDEYFYTDIESVKTINECLTYSEAELDARLLARIPGVKDSSVNGKVQINAAKIFVLSTTGGNSVRVALNDPVLVPELGGGDLPLESAEKAVQAVRMMLRDKKAGALPLRGSAV